jgi:hypothetical protein
MEWWVEFTRLSNDTRGFLLFVAMIWLVSIVAMVCWTIYEVVRLFA